jgi:restriction endonuclease S subunit
MPFGLKGIKHAECCERVKELKIRGTKSEPLFLQLMMVSLNRGGRCAVVVPDGMLVNGSSCHDETRKYLLDHFELKRVIKMKGQFFMNTGIQPSILFFENTGKPTSDVEFWDVIKASNGHINETMVLSVPRAKFDASCSFDMRRYQEVTAVANPAGFPMVKLSDVCEVSKGKRCLVSVESGGYPYQDVAHISRMVEKCILDTPAVLTPRAMSIGRFIYTDEKCHPSDDMFILKPKDNLNAKYLYYYCLLNLSTKFKESLHGVKPTIDYSVFDYTHIIIPPIETQKEIVATLDRIYAPGTTELAETLNLTDRAMDLVLANPGGASLEPIVEAQRLMRKSAQMVADVKAQMVADVKAQMAAIMKSIDMRGFPRGRLGESVSFLNGYAFTSEEFISSGVPIVKIKNIKKNVLSLDHANYSVKSATLSKYTVKQGDMVISLTGELSGDVAMNLSGLEWYLNQRVARIDVTNKQLIPQYLYYYMVYSGFTEAVRNLSTGSAQPNVSTKNIESLTLSLPPVEFQESVIGRLNALQTQVSSLENLCTLAEENARFILDSYLNTP